MQHWCCRIRFVLLAQSKMIEKSVMGESLFSDSRDSILDSILDKRFSILADRFSILDERFSIFDTRFSQESRIESTIYKESRSLCITHVLIHEIQVLKLQIEKNLSIIYLLIYILCCRSFYSFPNQVNLCQPRSICVKLDQLFSN